MTTKTAGELREIPLADLKIHAATPRTDVGDLSDLVASIKERGVQEPILVVAENGHFAIVAGRRRFEASKKAGRTTVPAIVRDLTPEDVATVALIENLQRKDLAPLEEAEAYRAWLTLTGKSQRDLAAAVGKDESTISNTLRLLEAPKPVKDALAKGHITAAHARAAMSVPESGLSQLDLTKSVSVHELEEQARRAKRAAGVIDKLGEAIAKAEAAGKVVTWAKDRHRDEIYVNGVEIDIEKAFGKPKKALAGMLSSGGYGYSTITRAQHDEVCECEAVAIGYQGQLEPACISPTGYKKAEAKARASYGRAAPAKRKKQKTAEERRKEAERDTKAAIREADEALNFKKLRTYHPLKTNVAPALLKGGLAGEPARLVLFGEVIGNSSGSNKSKTWEVELWKKIAKLPLKTVREYVARWAVAAALEEIRGTNRLKGYGTSGAPLGTNNAATITQLVNAHFGVKATKKAKR